MKLIVAAVICVGAAVGVIIYSQNSKVEGPPPITNQIKVNPPISGFKESDVLKFKISFGGDSVSLFKKDDQWRESKSNTAVDQWGVKKWAVILSDLRLAPSQPNIKPIGEVELETKSETLKGIFDDDDFQWSSGPLKGFGCKLSENESLKNLISEKLWALKSHEIKLCDPSSISKFEFSQWKMLKTKTQWFVSHENKNELAEQSQVVNFSKSVCDILVDNFVLKENQKESDLILKITNQSKVIEIKNLSDIFLISKYPNFKSHTLSELMKVTNPKAFLSLALEAAKIATDPKQDDRTRLDAIRKLRGQTSPEAMATLKTLLFENTDIDTFRYEAVDTLAATGTKAAYQLLVERLSQVGRSGFELRLARAIASSMGEFFNSDEKTPEEIRRPEVDQLIKAAQKNPPGK